MKQPGLNRRHRDQNPPKTGEIQQKRGDTLNRNLDRPIPQFPGNTRLDTMRDRTGEIGIEGMRREAAKQKP